MRPFALRCSGPAAAGPGMPTWRSVAEVQRIHGHQRVGTGFDAADRAEFWEQDMRGKIVKYKSFSIGVKDKPRFPSFLGLRSEIDL